MLPPFVSPSVYNSIKHKFFTHDCLYCRKTQCSQLIAQILKATTRHEGYFEGNGYQVTWTFGHLCEPKYPDITPRFLEASGSLGALPMVPPRFGIRLVE